MTDRRRTNKGKPKKNKPKPSHMIGAYAHHFHEGSRSEILADYLFSAWGTVTPVRRADDHGLDLYCTLADKIGRRAVVREYFVVQVKSDNSPWVFAYPESVRWLVEYPSPLFLAVVEKKKQLIRVYHVMPRFAVWALGKLPKRLKLKPEDADAALYSAWENAETVALKAPILRLTISDLLNDKKMKELRRVFAHWVTLDRKNCDLMRFGLLRFRMPYEHRVNELPDGAIVEMGNRRPENSFLRRGILTLAECAECLGGQLGSDPERRGTSKDLRAALRAALLVDHLQTTYGDVFAGDPRWNHRIPADLGRIVCEGLNKLLRTDQSPPYRYHGLEAVENSLETTTL